MRNTVFILTFLSLFACAAAQPTTGKCGKNVTWTLHSDGTLVLEGSGDTYDYGKKPQKSPFIKNGISEKIKVVDLTPFNIDGHLGNNLFYGCENLERVKLHQSQYAMLNSKAFTHCPLFTTIECSHSHIKPVKTQVNYYKVAVNAINFHVDGVKKCIVPVTSKKVVAKELFIPLEPFLPIENYDNLREEPFEDDYYGKGTMIGQWSDGTWNGVVKKTYPSSSWNVSIYKNGKAMTYSISDDLSLYLKHEDHRSEYWTISVYDGDKDQADFYDNELGLYRIDLRDKNNMLIGHKYFSLNGDVFIRKKIIYDKYGSQIKGIGEYYWANGDRYYGEIGSEKETILLNEYHSRSYDYYYKPTGKGIFFNKEKGELQCGLWDNGKYIGNSEIITLNDFWETPVGFFPIDAVAKFYVQKLINEWQEKQEFETTEEWQARVTETTRQKKADELYLQLQNDYLENYAKKINLNLRLGRYDADNRTYLVTDSVYGQMIVSLDNFTPQAFKTSWDKIIPVPTYFMNGNGIDILDMDFMLYDSVSQQYKRVAHYQKTAELTYVNVNIDYNFNPIALPQMGTIKGGGDIVTGNPTENNHVKNPPASPLSDVDLNIPVVDRTNYNTHVFIIANENYTKASEAPYALKDGRVFKEYCEKTLGVLPNHIKKYENATLGDLNECVAKMKQVGDVYREKANIIFYYAGHAYTDSSGVYFLPTDGNAQISVTSYSEQKLFDELGELPVNSVTCFIDACYSGKAGRGIIVQRKEGELKGNLVVISASSKNGTADQYSGKGHGLFTYCLLKKLRDTKGDVTLGELSDYIIEQVQRISLEVNDKLQTPTPIVSPFMELDWRQLKLNE